MVKTKNWQEGYDQNKAMYEKEKASASKVGSFLRKAGRKYFADPVIGALATDTEYDTGARNARKEVLGYGCGGKVKMANGGSVCRGGGAATKGTKFSGVK